MTNRRGQDTLIYLLNRIIMRILSQPLYLISVVWYILNMIYLKRKRTKAENKAARIEELKKSGPVRRLSKEEIQKIIKDNPQVLKKPAE